MRRKRLAALAIPAALLLAAFAPNPARFTWRERFDIVPGVQTLYLPNPIGSTMVDVDLGFTGGGNALRIQRVRANCGSPDVTFVDASPHDANAYFGDNHFGAEATYFEVTVENQSDRTVSLQVRMDFLRGNSPPCGL